MDGHRFRLGGDVKVNLKWGNSKVVGETKSGDISVRGDKKCEATFNFKVGAINFKGDKVKGRPEPAVCFEPINYLHHTTLHYLHLHYTTLHIAHTSR